MRWFTQIRGAFRNGILHASTTGKKIRRWSVLVALWLMTGACILLSVWAFTSTDKPFHGFLFAVNAFTFAITSSTVIFTASAAEWNAKTRTILQSGARR